MRKIFFGWWTVLASNVLMVWEDVKSYSFSVYLKPLSEEFGWTRAETSIPVSLGSLEGGFAQPLAGWAIDKYGPRALSLLGILVSATGLFLMYFINSLWYFIIVWGLITSTGFTLGYQRTLSATIAKWFVKKRGLALGAARTGTAFGGAIIPVLMTSLLYSWGWRLAFVIAGIATLTVGLPLVWFFVKPKGPEFYGLLPDGEKPGEGEDTESLIQTSVKYAAEHGEHDFTLRQAMRTKTFWCLAVSLAFYDLTTPIIMVHLIPYLTDIGFDPIGAATALSIMTLVSAPLRIVGGIIGDKIPLNQFRYALICFIFFQDILCWYLLLFPSSMTYVYVALILRGISLGLRIGMDIRVVLTPRYFGRRYTATIQGFLSPFRLIGSLLIPIYAGWVYDSTGSYQGTFWLIFFFTIVAIAVLSQAKPPKLD